MYFEEGEASKNALTPMVNSCWPFQRCSSFVVLNSYVDHSHCVVVSCHCVLLINSSLLAFGKLWFIIVASFEKVPSVQATLGQ